MGTRTAPARTSVRRGRTLSLLLLPLAGCAQGVATAQSPPAASPPFVELASSVPDANLGLPRGARRAESGYASWYGSFHHGRRTASGERFDKRAMTAAHRTLPFGTIARVTVPATGQSVVVRITDRGPYSRGRIIDLSEAAAEQLGIRGRGVAPVRVETE